MTWETASQVDLAESQDDEESSRNARNRSDYALDRMEAARGGRNPVILYVATASEDRRFQRAREACSQLESQIFGNYHVASAMQDFTLIRVNVEDLNRETVRRYGIQANSAPQMIVYDADLRRLSSMTGVQTEVVVRDRLRAAKEQNDALLERRDREQARERTR